LSVRATTPSPCAPRCRCCLFRGVGSFVRIIANAQEGNMRLPRRLVPRPLVAPLRVVRAHCDLPCGVYDPAQARIEAESVKAIAEKYQANSDPEFRTRAIMIKEQRADLVKHHLWVLWTDYFKAPHFEKYPNLNQLFNEATKLAGASGAKGSVDPAVGDQLLGKIDEIAEFFGETKKAPWPAVLPPRTTGGDRLGVRPFGVRTTGRCRSGACGRGDSPWCPRTCYRLPCSPADPA